jgi:hypothetical protein
VARCVGQSFRFANPPSPSFFLIACQSSNCRTNFGSCPFYEQSGRPFSKVRNSLRLTKIGRDLEIGVKNIFFLVDLP